MKKYFLPVISLLILSIIIAFVFGLRGVTVCEEPIDCNSIAQDGRCPSYIAGQAYSACSPEDVDCCLNKSNNADIGAASGRCWVDVDDHCILNQSTHDILVGNDICCANGESKPAPCSTQWSDAAGACIIGNNCIRCNNDCCRSDGWHYDTEPCPLGGTVSGSPATCYYGTQSCTANEGCGVSSATAPYSCNIGGWYSTYVSCLNEPNHACYFNSTDPCTDGPWGYRTDPACYLPGTAVNSRCYYDKENDGRSDDCTTSGCLDITYTTAKPDDYFINAEEHCCYNCNVVCDAVSQSWVRTGTCSSGCIDDGPKPGDCPCTATGWLEPCNIPSDEKGLCGNNLDDDMDGYTDCEDADCACESCGTGWCQGDKCGEDNDGSQCICNSNIYNPNSYSTGCRTEQCVNNKWWEYVPANNGAVCNGQCGSCASGYCNFRNNTVCNITLASDTNNCHNPRYCGNDYNCHYINIQTCYDDAYSCCPSGCTAATDPDCTATAICQNGFTEIGETCDGSSNPILNDDECNNLAPLTMCNYTTRKYCTKDSFGNCVDCNCQLDVYNCGPESNSDYCNNCNGHCGDGAKNCDEACDGGINDVNCPNPANYCNYTTRKYFEYADANGNCSGCSCVFDTAAEGEDYCANCNGHCGDGAKNCDEACDGVAANNTDCPNPANYCDYNTKRYYIYPDANGNCNGCSCVSDTPVLGDYCANCDHCSDDIQNCGETSVNRGGTCSCDILTATIASNCAGDCKEGEQIKVNATYSGSDCPGQAYLQIDAMSGSCILKGNVDDPMNQMKGIQAICTSSGNCDLWSIGDIPMSCLGKTITPVAAGLYSGGFPGIGDWKAGNDNPEGSFVMFPGCPIGTKLCTDGKCEVNCAEEQCDSDSVCEPGEGCGCSDCVGNRDTCESYLECESGLCAFTGCPENTTYCSDNTCKADCGTFDVACNTNGICDMGESCICADCDGRKDNCDDGLLCDDLTEWCKSWPKCGFNQTTCKGGTCSKKCSPEGFQGCNGNPNGICEYGEGCTCSDCYGSDVPCKENLRCDPELKLCRYKRVRSCEPVHKEEWFKTHDEMRYICKSGDGNIQSTDNDCTLGNLENGAALTAVCPKCICCNNYDYGVIIDLSKTELKDSYDGYNFRSCPMNDTDVAYCEKINDCVYNGKCYSKWALKDIDGDGIEEECDDWTEITEDCGNGIDDDFDSLIDLADPSCDGYIEGIVSYGALPLTPAKITAVGFNKNVSESSSDLTGGFSIRVRGEGIYDVIAEMLGFIPKAVYDIYVPAKSIVFINFSLEPTSNICRSDCTFNGICEPSCEGLYGCTYPNDETKYMCYGKMTGFRVKINESHEVVCCNGEPREIVTMRPVLDINAKNVVTVRKIVLYDGKLANLVISVFD
ncbi:carboxypeptidase regulatory-like domain-containing protein [Candidatus Woesearchaeota archaeon]|nr:carboxypeptidase regulatory-like domain-containing protein [Candidatus Woesearchaeota archaeon]